MADATFRATAPLRVADASVFVATIGVVIALIALLLPLDLVLARVDRRESAAYAAAEYRDGIALLRAGRAADAAEHFRTAVAIDRTNVQYSLAFAEAMLQGGRASDAEATLRTLLERAENDGAVNLTMARVMIHQGRDEEAKAFFHRAIFGRWGADSLERRYQARFELIDLLARQGASRELLAELLPLEDVPSDSVALRLKLGRLFILAGSPARAANMFRELLRSAPNEGEAYAGMGEAELALGNIRTAHSDLAEAARLRPDDAQVAGKLALLDTALAMDPTARGIDSKERLARSRAFVLRAMSAVESCGASRTASLDSAMALLAPRPARHRTKSDASADALMAAGASVWASRPAGCASATRDAVLPLIVARVTQ